MDFDPVSHAGGFGAGQVLAEKAAAHERNLANINLGSAQDASLALAMAVKQARDQNEALEGEIANRWIPYAVKLNASLVARRVEREDLIAELRRLDPANAENVARQADQHRLEVYAALDGAQIHQAVRKDSEEGRLDR